MPMNPIGPDLWLTDEPLVLPVKGTSMKPLLRDGDVIEVVRAAPESVGRGDILVFMRSGELTVHRFLTRRGDRFLEKGDAQGQGNWHSWPDSVGIVRRIRRSGIWTDLNAGRERRALRRAGRRHLIRHRACRTASFLPGSLTRRVFLKAVELLLRA
jgi:hypothetical protein